MERVLIELFFKHKRVIDLSGSAGIFLKWDNHNVSKISLLILFGEYETRSLVRRRGTALHFLRTAE
jgi:hypothetical protein